MPTIIAWLIAKIGKDALKRTLMVTLTSVQVVGTIAFYSFIVISISTVFGWMQTFYDLLGSFSSQDANITCFLKTFGVLDGINNGVAFFIPATVFLFSVVSYTYLMKAKKAFYDYMKDLTRLI